MKKLPLEAIVEADKELRKIAKKHKIAIHQRKRMRMKSETIDSAFLRIATHALKNNLKFFLTNTSNKDFALLLMCKSKKLLKEVLEEPKNTK